MYTHRISWVAKTKLGGFNVTHAFNTTADALALWEATFRFRGISYTVETL